MGEPILKPPETRYFVFGINRKSTPGRRHFDNEHLAARRSPSYPPYNPFTWILFLVFYIPLDYSRGNTLPIVWGYKLYTGVPVRHSLG